MCRSETEYKFIDIIVSEISKKLNHTPLHVADNPVGLESPVLKVKSLIGLGSNDKVDMVGIWGAGGIGKTTIARAAYNSFFDQFDGSCFLADIREDAHKYGLAHLQETLLSEILGEDIKIRDVNKGIPLIKRRLQRKKILLILDDVDDQEQLKAIAGGQDWFGFGSRIIITSRDKHLLSAHGVKKFYEVKELNKKDALELFSWKTFGSDIVDPNYADVLSRALSYVGGLPLALEVIGSNLCNRSINEWNSALDKYERIPNTKVDKILKVSYDGLEEDEKNVFLDIACFFNKCERSYVNEMMHVRGFHPEHSIEVLIDKSLMKIDNKNGCVRMHDLIQDMGREIVRQGSLELGKRSRLWYDEDIVRVLQNDMGTAKVEVIVLYSSKDKEVRWNGRAFKKMSNLRVLIVGDVHFSAGPEHLPNSLRVLDWNGYPSPSLPCDFQPNELRILRLPHSCLKWDKPFKACTLRLPHSCLKWDQPLKMFVSLGLMDFDGCKFLIQVPNLSGLPNLRALCLDNCTNLNNVDESIGFLDKLILLSAQGCIKLHSLVPAINLPSLETLDLRWCTSLQSFPEVLGKMENIREVNLDHTAIKELPFSIHNLFGLERLYLRSCNDIMALPSSIGLLPKLEVILFHNKRGFRLHDPYNAQEAMKSREFFCTGQYVNDPLIPPFLVRRSGSGVNIRNGSSVSFWYRKRLPVVTFSVESEPIDKALHGLVSELSFCTVVDGAKYRFSHYIAISVTMMGYGLGAAVCLGDSPCGIAQCELERARSAHEWKRAEVSCEIKFHMPYDPKLVSEGHSTSIAGTIKQATLAVYENDSRMKDIRFTDPDCEVTTCDASCHCNDTSRPASTKT